MNKQKFMQEILKNGQIELENNLKYVVVTANEKNIEMNEGFKKALKEDGRYGAYIGFVTFEKQAPYSMDSLPIYGGQNGYVTKWFTHDFKTAIETDLKDRKMKLLKRVK